MIFIINKYKMPEIPEDALIINIMRGSVFGNPFIIGRDGNREDVIAKHLHYLRQRYMNSLSMRKNLELLAIESLKRDIYLKCCCAPAPCHGDNIKAAIEGISAKLKK